MSRRSSPSNSPSPDHGLGVHLHDRVAVPGYPLASHFPKQLDIQQQEIQDVIPLRALFPVDPALDPNPATTTQSPADVVRFQDFGGLFTETPHASTGRRPSPPLSPPGEESTNNGNPPTKHPSPKASLSPCFTRTPLAHHPQPPDPSPVQAPSRREGGAKEKPAPYEVRTPARPRQRITPKDDLDAWYDAVVDELAKDPKYRFYRREVIEEAVRGADYRPKPKAKRRRPGTASSRQRAPDPGSSLPSTANISHALPQRIEHDHVESLARQNAVEGIPLVHCPTPVRIIDNHGHLVSGIPTRNTTKANPSLPAPSVLSVDEGLERHAFGFIQSELNSEISLHNSITPFDRCDQGYTSPPNPSESALLHSLVEPSLFPSNALGSWLGPSSDPFESAYSFLSDLPDVNHWM